MSNIVHKNYKDLFDNIDNLFSAWLQFRRGKPSKIKIMDYEIHLADNIFHLHDGMRDSTYKHSNYEHFIIHDNKKRDIHEAETKDKIVHHIIYDHLISIYEPIFIKDSYSSRVNKGSHKALQTFKYFSKIAGDPNKNVFILKCDVKKYFDNIDHAILLEIIRRRIKDEKIIDIIGEIIHSFNSKDKVGKGIPLGNVTSQIFANIYLNELDCFVKKELKIRFYIRYNDDFVIVDNNQKRLSDYLAKIKEFLRDGLSLDIPEGKVSIRKLSWGIDFLGFTVLPNCVLLRDQTKAKIFERLNRSNVESYLGLLKHCNSYNLRSKLKSILKFDDNAYEDDL